MQRRIDRHAYERVKGLLSEGKLDKVAISKTTGVSHSTVKRIAAGTFPRPPAYQPPSHIAGDRVVAAEKFDKILGYYTEHQESSQRDIAKALGIPYSTVCKVLGGKCCRGIDREEIDQTVNIVAARTFDKVMGIHDENPELSADDISKQTGLSVRAVRRIISGEYIRGADVCRTGKFASREPLRCPTCRRRVVQLPCVRCATKEAMRSGELRRISTSEDDELRYKLPEDAERRRRAVRCLHMLRMRQRKEPEHANDDAA